MSAITATAEWLRGVADWLTSIPLTIPASEPPLPPFDHVGMALVSAGANGKTWVDFPSGGGPPAALPVPRAGLPPTLVGIGDSTTEPSGERGSYLDYLMLAGSPIRVLKNAGVGGQTSTQMRARFDADVVALAPALVALLAGANDSNLGVPTATSVDNFRWMYERALAMGILPICCTLPRTADVPVQRINAWIRGYAQAHNLPLVDWARVCMSPDGSWKPGYAVDNTHPSHVGCAAMAAEFRRVVEPLVVPVGGPGLAETNIDPTNLVPNPLIVSSATGIPTGWTQFSGVPRQGKTFSVVPDPLDATGTRHCWRVESVDSLVNDSYGIVLPAGTVAPGHVLEFAGRIRAFGQAGMNWNLVLAVSGVPICVRLDGWTEDVDGCFAARVVVPASGGAVAAYLYVGVGNGTFEISQWHLLDLTALGTV